MVYWWLVQLILVQCMVGATGSMRGSYSLSRCYSCNAVKRVFQFCAYGWCSSALGALVVWCISALSRLVPVLWCMCMVFGVYGAMMY